MGAKASTPDGAVSLPEPLDETEVDLKGDGPSTASLPRHFKSRLSPEDQAIINQAEEFRQKFAVHDSEGAAAVQKLIDMVANRRGGDSEYDRKTSVVSASLAGSDAGGAMRRENSSAAGYSAYTAPSRFRNSGAFVHGTKFKHLNSILEQGLKAHKSEIYMMDEIRPDGRIPGLLDPPELLILIDEDKARRSNMQFTYDPKQGSWVTTGIEGVVRPWFFQRVVDQRPESRGNVLFQSKDDPIMSSILKKNPKRLLHFTYWENVPAILRDGIVPAKNPRSEARKAFGDLLRGAENHVYTIEPLRARSKVQPAIEKDEKGHRYALDIAGLERPADAFLTIDVERAKALGVNLEIIQSSDREETLFIKGPVPPEAIVGIEANEPVEIPDGLRAKIVDPKNFQDIPIIDLQADDVHVITQLKYACEVVGFMQVVGHGVSEELQERHMRLHKAFFALPTEQKLAIKTNLDSPVRGYFGKGGEDLDGVLGEAINGTVPKKSVQDKKEGLDCNGMTWATPGEGYVSHIFGLPSQLPPEEVLPGFRQTLQEYQDEMFKLSRRLLRLMAVILDQNEDFFEAHLTNPVATHRLLHYWPITDFKKEIGVGPHTDYGLLTILKQDMVGGLQVLNAKELHWVHAMPLENSFTINLGDMLARWTAHRFKSTVHRVVNISPMERYSVPYFLEPNLDSVITPGGLCGGPGGPPGEKALEAGTILEHFYVATGMITPAHREAYNKRLKDNA